MEVMGHKSVDADSDVPPAELDATSAATVAMTMQALAAPSRLLILSRLRRAPCTVSELATDVAMEQSAVSHQLRLLRNLGLVQGTRRGKTTVYALYDDHVARLLDEAVYHSEHLRLGARDHATDQEPAVLALSVAGATGNLGDPTAAKPPLPALAWCQAHGPEHRSQPVDEQHRDAMLLRPAVDPMIPAAARDLLLPHDATAPPARLLPAEPDRRLTTVSGATTGLTAGMVVALTGVAPWAIGVLVFQGAVGWQSTTGRWALMIMEMIVMVTMVVFGTRAARVRQARTRRATATTRRKYRGHYVTDADLDGRARILMRRAQEAVDSVRAAQVSQAGLLYVDPALGAQEWDIAVSLREQARLRASRAEIAPFADPTGPAAELLREHQDAADEAEASTAARVEALERLAATVRTTESAYRDLQVRVQLAELTGAHLSMLARTAADAHGIAELTDMTERARAIRSELTDSASEPADGTTDGTTGSGDRD